jgi:hypothetical protein
MRLIDLVRRAAEAAGRDPAAIEMLAGCPDLLPGSGKDAEAAIKERVAQGIGPHRACPPRLSCTISRRASRTSVKRLSVPSAKKRNASTASICSRYFDCRFSRFML